MKRFYSPTQSLSLAIALLLAGFSSGQEMRTWSDKSGKFETKAELVSQDASSVELRIESGKMVRVAKSRLSAEDQEYLRSLSAKVAASKIDPDRIASVLRSKPDSKQTASTLSGYLQSLGVPVYLDKRALERKGLTADTNIVPAPSAETVAKQIDAICGPLDLDWQPLSSLIFVSTHDQFERNGSVAAYQVPTARMDYASATAIVQKMKPESWLANGGTGISVPFPPKPVLLVRQSPHVHRMLIDQLKLKSLAMPPVHPLDRMPVTIDGTAITLAELATELSSQIGKKVTVDENALQPLGLNNVRLRVQLKEVSAAELMDCVLRSVDCTWLERGSSVVITTENAADSELKAKRYPRNLVARGDATTLINMFTQLVANDSWSHYGGKGQASVSGSSVLVKNSQPALRELDRLESLLKRLK